MRGQDVGDGRDTHRAMLVVQQALLDHVYNARGIVAPCSMHIFEGRAWLTAEYVPGACAPPDDPSVVHSVAVELDHPQEWGHPVGYGTLIRGLQQARMSRPTLGLLLTFEPHIRQATMTPRSPPASIWRQARWRT